MDTIKDNTIIEAVQNSNTIPKPQINIPYTPPKQTKSSPAGYIVLGIIIIIVLGVIISNNNSYVTESYDYEVESTEPLLEAPPYADAVPESQSVSFENNSSTTAYLSYAFYDNGWETIGWYEISPNNSQVIDLPVSFTDSSIYYYAEDSSGGKWEGSDGYFCIEHGKAFHLFSTENCNEQAGFYKLDLTGSFTTQGLRD